MNTDRYTKTVLTVIAACLLWLCVKPIFQPASVAAAQNAQNVQNVRIIGWQTKIYQLDPNDPDKPGTWVPYPQDFTSAGNIIDSTSLPVQITK